MNLCETAGRPHKRRSRDGRLRSNLADHSQQRCSDKKGSAMFGFPRNGRKEVGRARHLEAVQRNGSEFDDKLPDRPSLDGYVVCELPESLSAPLLKAFLTRAA